MARFGPAALPVIVWLIAVLTPLAYASPPDPPWIPGIYDDGDYDDVMGLITSEVGVVALRPPVEVRLFAPQRTPLPEGAANRLSTPSFDSFFPRAPPDL
jgi:hypothetical protein